MTDRRYRHRRKADDDAAALKAVARTYFDEITALREERDQAMTRVRRLRAAGDALASQLARSSGIDPMRGVLLAQWRDAKDGPDPPTTNREA